MDIDVISREIIKPYPHLLPHLKPFKLTFIDQLMLTFYVPLVLFYPRVDEDTTYNQITTQLKRTLSQTLSTLYPLSGRVHDNMFVDNYEEGVPYVETRVKCRLLDFLQHPGKLELLNQLLPCAPFSLESKSESSSAPLVIIQANIFDCGGLALGVCFSHKINDGATMSTFLKTWSANNTGHSCNHENLNSDVDNFMEASSRFLPVAPSLIAQIGSNSSMKVMIKRGKCITRRFVFDAKAIATLKDKVQREGVVVNPSRNEVLSSFIWKSCMAAAASSTSSSGPSLSVHSINIRHRTIPPLPKDSIGNHLWMGVAISDEHTERGELGDLVALIRETLMNVNSDFLNEFQGSEGFGAVTKHLEHLGSLVLNNPKVFVFSSWLNFGFNDVDFGWGKPVWVGISGEASSSVLNFVIFKELGSHNEIEAWMNLDEEIMSLIEQDPEFLAFATPDPAILVPTEGQQLQE